MTFLVVGFFVGSVSLPVLVLGAVAGALGGSAVSRLRTWGEHYRFMRKAAASLEKTQAAAWLHTVTVESRPVLRRLILASVAILGVIAWAAAAGGRWWALALCITALVYALSSVKPLAGSSSSFMKFTVAAKRGGCRIILFRSFDTRASAMARSSLVPILAAYGEIEIAMDETLEQASGDGVFGEQVEDLSTLCTIHRLAHTGWQERVAELIAACDIAVVDATIVSPGVIWEFAQCYRHLPAHRVYAIVDGAAFPDETLANYLTRFYAALGTHPEMPRDLQPRLFLLNEGSWRDEALASDIHRKMLEIVAIEESASKSEFPGAML